jgi:hypothetical protein
MRVVHAIDSDLELDAFGHDLYNALGGSRERPRGIGPTQGRSPG